MQTGDAAYDSTKLLYAAKDPVNGVDLEMLQIGGALIAYLQVHSQVVPPYRGNGKEALVTLKVDDQVTSGIAERHEGGQRLRLTRDLQEQLLEALQAQKSVQLQLEGYQAFISAEDFPEHFKTFQKTKVRNPFQLPFKL